MPALVPISTGVAAGRLLYLVLLLAQVLMELPLSKHTGSPSLVVVSGIGCVPFTSWPRLSELMVSYHLPSKSRFAIIGTVPFTGDNSELLDPYHLPSGSGLEVIGTVPFTGEIAFGSKWT